MNESDMALMLASRLARLTSLEALLGRVLLREGLDHAHARRCLSARSPTTRGDAGARLAEGDLRPPGEEHGGQHHQRQHLKVSSASRGFIDSMTTTMPTSTKLSPTRVTRPCESRSLITATSLITREMVTPTMCVSW